MDPGIIISMLQATVKFSDVIESVSKNTILDMTASEVVAKLKTPKKSLTRRILKFLVEKSQKSVQYRELSKSNCIYIIHEFRHAFRHMGKLMTQEGFLPDPELIFYLTPMEMKKIIRTKSIETVKKAVRRQRLIPQLNKVKYPELNYGVPKPINQNLGSRNFTGNLVSLTD